MTYDKDKIISVLNDLIETCKDGEKGFREASEKVKNTEVKNLFQRYSQQRSAFISELQREVRALGGDPAESGSASGSLHRGWMNLKSAITGKDEDSIIAEAERGEDVAVKTYREALEKDLPANVKEVIRRQFTGIQEAHDRVRAFERATERK